MMTQSPASDRDPDPSDKPDEMCWDSEESRPPRRRRRALMVTVAAATGVVVVVAGIVGYHLWQETASRATELAPFAREWDGMRESVVIDGSGHGHFHYMMHCATCSMAEMPYNTLDFTLASVSKQTASGTITASSDPHFPVGEPVTATLAPPDTIHWTIGGMDEGLFCGSDPGYCGY